MRGNVFANVEAERGEDRFVVTKLEVLKMNSDDVVHIWDPYEELEEKK